MKNLKNKKGNLSIFIAVIITPLLIFMSIALAKSDLIGFKQEMRGYLNSATKQGADSAVTLADSHGQFCVILNDASDKRFDAYGQVTTVLSKNFENLDFNEVTIDSIGTKDYPNAWGWNSTTNTFNRSSQHMNALQDYFQKGEIEIVIRGRFKPSYMLLPSMNGLYRGLRFTVDASAKCVVHQK